MNLEIANKLYTLRKKNGLSQEALAEKLGISRQSISKWERAESSPDTDNLIALARLYNISLDELLLNDTKKSEQKESNSEQKVNDKENKQDNKSFDTSDSEKIEANSAEIPDVGHKFVNVNDGNNIVHVGTKGVFVKDDEGNEVNVGLGGIYVNGEKKKFDHKYKSHRNNDNDSCKSSKSIKAFKSFPYPVFAVIAYLMLGFFVPCGWSVGWLVFLTIPLYYTTIEAIAKRNPHIFCYPVLVVIIYLFFGMTMNLWHPLWVIYLTIPLYYAATEIFKK